MQYMSGDVSCGAQSVHVAQVAGVVAHSHRAHHFVLVITRGTARRAPSCSSFHRCRDPSYRLNSSSNCTITSVSSSPPATHTVFCIRRIIQTFDYVINVHYSCYNSGRASALVVLTIQQLTYYSAIAYASMLCRRGDISKYFDSTQFLPQWLFFII